MREVFEALLAHMDRQEACILVSAVGGEGSAPRKSQSHMLVDAGGRVCGTVGGGAVEGNSITYAKELLAQKQSALREFELYERATDDIGMICGGKVSVHFLYAAPGDSLIRPAATAAVSAYTSGEDAWLMLDKQRHVLTLYDGAKQYGGTVSQDVLLSLNASSSTCMLNDTEYYTEQLSYDDRVFIFGGGHVAQALVPVLASVDFRCIVIEDREEFCRNELFPDAYDVRLLTEREWNTALRVTSNDCICIMTRGHNNDLICQAFALETQAGYIGVIGSRRKIASVNAQLKEMGFNEAQISRITTPIGLEIGAVTPAEIAVSIAAQMIAHRAALRHGNIKKSCMA